jgi:indole-3-glycerol phosphate synthase
MTQFADDQLAELGREVGLAVLVEVHDEEAM